MDKIIKDAISEGTVKLSGNGKEGKTDFSILNHWPIMQWDWPRIVVFVPMPQALSYADEVFPYFWRIAQHGVPLLPVRYGFADRVRNIAARTFMKTDFTHILMLDADHKHPMDIVKQLAYWVLEDPERLIVGGLNFKRAEPYTPCATVEVEGGYASLYEWEIGDDPLLDVASIGFGSVLIAQEAFERIPEPWFMHDWSNAGNDDGYNWPGHDVYFCKQARDAGIKIYCDLGLTSDHGSTIWIGEKTFSSYKRINPRDESEVIKNA